MPYREKVAWLSILAIVVAFAPYFTLAAIEGPPAPDTLPNFDLLWRYTVTAMVQLTILGIGHLLLRARSPEEAREPKDERDRDIERRSMVLAYYVLMFGAVAAGMVLPFVESGWSIVNATLLVVVGSEVVHYAAIVRGYRKSAA